MNRKSVCFCAFWAILMLFFSTGFIMTMAEEENKIEEEAIETFYSVSIPLKKDIPDVPLKTMISLKEINFQTMSIESSEIIVKEENTPNQQETTKDNEIAQENNIEKEEEIKDKIEEECEGVYEAPKLLSTPSTYISEIGKTEISKVQNPITTFKDVPIDPMPESYLEVKKMVSTAYCHCIKCCGKSENHPAYGITYSGINLLDGEVHKVVAADIKILPLGTIVYIKDYGIATVGDIGGGIKGNRIDVYFPTHDEAWDWAYGMQEIEVYVLAYPEE